MILRGPRLDQLTVNLDGVFWYPLSTGAAVQAGKKILPLASAYERVKVQLDVMVRTGAAPLMTFPEDSRHAVAG
jgi:hypothetical protein